MVLDVVSELTKDVAVAQLPEVRERDS